MYVGSTGPSGALHLVYELVQNSVDEAMAGHCSQLSVRLHADGSVTVADDGRGIPIGPHPSDGRPAIEVVLTTLHAGGKFGAQSPSGTAAYGIAGGLHGVGISCVNALSDLFEVAVQRDGGTHTITFSRGEARSPLHRTGDAEGSGTAVRFRPDPDIFEGVSLDVRTLRRRLQEQAFLQPGLTVELTDARGQREIVETFRYEGGIAGFVAHLVADRIPLHPQPIAIAGEHDGHHVDVAMQWTTAYAEETLAYVNAIFTSQGGSHVEGLRSALARVINARARTEGMLHDDADEQIAGYDVREGLVAVLSLKMHEPEYEGQTKSTLTSHSATAAVERVVEQALNTWMDAHPTAATAIVGKALEASRARAAARRASERARYQSIDQVVSKEVYKQQFGIRSKNWHQSASWITDDGILASQADMWDGPDDARVLDVCCGSGVVGNAFKGKVGHITGLDLTPEMIAMAETRLDVVHQGDVYDMPFEDNQFDLVCNREVLHLLPRPDIPVGQIFRVLKPGGTFIVSQLVPYGPEDAPWFFRIVKKKQPLFFNNLMAEDMVKLLEDAGFVDIVMKELICWEDIDVWIDTWETPNLHRHEIRQLYYDAPAEVRRVHPFEIRPDGGIIDQWRWVVLRGRKPSA
jgi:DNA gyrase subunit B